MAVAAVVAKKATLNKLTDFSTSLIPATAADGFTITTPDLADTTIWIQNTNTGSTAAVAIVIAAGDGAYIASGIGTLTTTVNDYAMIGPLESGRFSSTSNTITISITSTAVANVSACAIYTAV